MPLRLRFEELDLEPGFEGRDVAADGALRDEELLRGAGEAAATGAGFEGAQGVQRGEVAGHLHEINSPEGAGQSTAIAWTVRLPRPRNGHPASQAYRLPM